MGNVVKQRSGAPGLPLSSAHSRIGADGSYRLSSVEVEESDGSNLLCGFGNSYLNGTRDHSYDIADQHSA
jgi:hypothetical protein